MQRNGGPRNPFVGESVPSLQELFDRTSQDDKLSKVQRRDICSAIRTTADWFGVHPTALPASNPFLRERFKRFHPAQAGVGKKRLANVRYALGLALRRYGGTGGRHYFAPLTHDWRTLWEKLPSKYEECALGRFFRYLSAGGITPAEVNDEVSRDFLAALQSESLIANPREAHKNMTRVWNQMTKCVPSWPQIKLTEPCYDQQWGLPWSKFPRPFESKVDRFLQARPSKDIFADDGPDRALGPRTIETQKDHFRCFAGALVQRGHSASAIGSPRYLVKPEHYREALRFWLDRRDQKPTPYIASVASTLLKYAKQGARLSQKDREQVERDYRRLCARIVPHRPRTDELLTQFDSALTRRRFLAYPSRKIAAVLRNDPGGAMAALEVQWAVMTELWLFVPVRLINFANMRLDQHLFWPNGDLLGPLRVRFDGSEIKNREDQDFEIPAEVAEHVRLYVDEFRPRLVEGVDPWLWPGRGGRHKHVVTLRYQFCRAVRTETGIEVTPHLIRKIGPRLFLEIHPEMREIIRHVLGHRSMRSTSLYTGAERRAALRVYTAEILHQRHDALARDEEA